MSIDSSDIRYAPVENLLVQKLLERTDHFMKDKGNLMDEEGLETLIKASVQDLMVHVRKRDPNMVLGEVFYLGLMGESLDRFSKDHSSSLPKSLFDKYKGLCVRAIDETLKEFEGTKVHIETKIESAITDFILRDMNVTDVRSLNDNFISEKTGILVKKVVALRGIGAPDCEGLVKGFF